jgi:hypothetical protein
MGTDSFELLLKVFSKAHGRQTLVQILEKP